MTGALDFVLEQSLVGYTAIGHRLRRLAPITTSMAGRRVVITGASSGLGAETARTLATLGAELVLVGRNVPKTERVAAEARAAGATASVERCDLSSLRDTDALAGRLLAQEAPIHVLINNAGVLLPERSETDEGVETTYATNLLSHYHLTERLWPKLGASAPARVINVSSGGMYTQRIRVDDLDFERGRFDGAVAYARTKRGQVIMTERWAERGRADGIAVYAMHPGWADTPGVQRSLPTFRRVTRAVLRDDAQGADTIVWLAAETIDGPSGGFFHDRRRFGTHRSPLTRERPEDRDALEAAMRARIAAILGR